jgi:protein associated with RNAse G/E
MRAGEIIYIRALKSDGSCYRHWRARVESISDEGIVTLNRPGDEVGGPAGGWEMKHTTRNFYWFAKPYNLAEVYHTDGRLKQIYIHIASPVRACDRDLIYTDYELDVVKKPGEGLLVRDEDEFAHACAAYGYSHEFQCSCRDAVNEAIEVASCWRVAGPPQARRRRPDHGPRARERPRGRIQPEVRTVTPATDSSTRSTDV